MRLWNRFVNEKYLCPFDAGRVIFLAGLAVVRLAGRWSGGAYLAIHPRTGRFPLAHDVLWRFAVWWCVNGFRVHLQSFAVEDSFKAIKSFAQHRFFPHLERVYTHFFHWLPYSCFSQQWSYFLRCLVVLLFQPINKYCAWVSGSPISHDFGCLLHEKLWVKSPASYFVIRQWFLISKFVC